MLGYIIYLISYLKIFINIVFYSYIYKYLFNKCNQKTIIEGKKKKHLVKSKICLSTIYLFLLVSIYSLLNPYMVVTLLFIVSIGAILILQKFNHDSLKVFNKLDEHKMVIKAWKFLYYSMTITFKVLDPIHSIINLGIQKNKKYFSLKNIKLIDNLEIFSNLISDFSKESDSSTVSKIQDYVSKNSEKSSETTTASVQNNTSVKSNTENQKINVNLTHRKKNKKNSLPENNDILNLFSSMSTIFEKIQENSFINQNLENNDSTIDKIVANINYKDLINKESSEDAENSKEESSNNEENTNNEESNNEESSNVVESNTDN